MANHVGAYVDRCRELGVNPPRKVVGHLAREVATLEKEGQPETHIALGIRLLAEKGGPPTSLPYLLVEAVRRTERADLAAFYDEWGWPTGCRFSRGTHAFHAVYDPLGIDRRPEGWTHPKPGRAEVEEILKALDAIGHFLRGGGKLSAPTLVRRKNGASGSR